MVWAIPCMRVRRRPPTLLDLIGVQIDSVVVDSIPKDVQFDATIRLVGPKRDFRDDHLIQVVLSDPQLVEAGALDVPVRPRTATTNHIPGYEINHHVGVRIDFEADQPGGYDLSFALDGHPQHHCKTTLSVVLPDSNRPAEESA